MTVTSCKECRFSIPIENELVGVWSGECRLNPPQIILIPQGINSGHVVPAVAFPQVNEKLGCFSGEKRIELIEN